MEVVLAIPVSTHSVQKLVSVQQHKKVGKEALPAILGMSR